MLLEICTNSLRSAINAQKGGAQRIELCCNLEQGGLTPSASAIQLARKYLTIDIFVLIRPRISHFHYTELEFEQMVKDILFCKEIGINGVVFGILNAQQEIDTERNKYLLEIAKPMQCTFHRAFDCLKHPMEGLEKIISLGFDRILTSGLQPTALQGQILIKKLIEASKNRITILPGSGLNSQNIAEFLELTKAKEIHASAKKVIPPKKNNIFSVNYFETNIEEVKQLNAILQQFK